jgi:ribosomal protein S27AE
MDQANALNAPEVPTGTSPATEVHHPLVTANKEQCPSCGTAVAADQRYCLTCGQRCGEPRLPFMNAVTFMDAMKQPKTAAAAPPAKPKRRGISANAALIAGVGTLILAMGVGVLIGRSGNNSSTATPAAAQIIKVPAGGGAETATASTGKAAGGSGGSAANGKAKKPDKAALKKEAESQKGAEEVLKPSAGVKLPPATVKPGSSCSSGTAGCKGGEFTGEYFGGE